MSVPRRRSACRAERRPRYTPARRNRPSNTEPFACAFPIPPSASRSPLHRARQPCLRHHIRSLLKPDSRRATGLRKRRTHTARTLVSDHSSIPGPNTDATYLAWTRTVILTMAPMPTLVTLAFSARCHCVFPASAPRRQSLEALRPNVTEQECLCFVKQHDRANLHPHTVACSARPCWLDVSSLVCSRSLLRSPHV